MDKRVWVFFILFSLLIPSLVNAYNITFVPENISQNYIINIHNLNNTFNQTYEVYGRTEIVNLSKGVYYITITSENYNPINIELNLTENTTLQLYFNSNVIGYGIQNYNYLIFTLMLIFTIFGLMIVMVYYMKGVKIK